MRDSSEHRILSLQGSMKRARSLTVWDLLLSAAVRHRDATFLQQDDVQLTYAEVCQRAERLAVGLHNQGVRRGGRVAVLAENRLEYALLVYAAAATGASVAAMNWRLRPQELAQAIDVARPGLIFVSARYSSLLAETLEASGGTGARIVPIDAGSSTELEALSEALIPFASLMRDDLDAGAEWIGQARSEDILTIIYTSGTTGVAKGAAISHRAILSRAMVMSSELALSSSDTFIAWSPMFHTLALDYLLITGIVGGKVVIEPKFDAMKILHLIREHEVGWLPLVPGVIEPLLQTASVAGEGRSFKVRTVGAVADLVDPADIARLTQLLDAPYFNTFGSTEAGTLPSAGTFIDVGDVPVDLRKAQSPFCQIRLVDDFGSEVPDGTPGEMLLRSPTLFTGYIDAPAANEAAFRGGWFHTGDIMKRNSDGTLDFCGRTSNMIKSGGENIYPAEVERSIRNCPGVSDVFVFPVSDANWGEVPVAVVVSSSGMSLSPGDVREACRRELASYKVPKFIKVIRPSQVPLDEVGKVSLKILRQRWPEW